MSSPGRLGYLDWLRGVAVLIMIEAHLLDSWTATLDRGTSAFRWAIAIGGMGGPLFLFLAGAAVALSAAARQRRTGDPATAASLVVRRGLVIFGLAFLFRIQAWVLGWSSPRALLKVDILNVLGLSIAASALLWGAVRSTRARLVAFATATVVLALLTPLLQAARIDSLPDPVEAYIRPIPYLSNFTLFPWSAFVFAGVIPGVLLASTPLHRAPGINAWLFGFGLMIAGLSFAASYLPSPYPSSSFWETSPCFFFLRAGLMTAAIGAAYAWQSRPGGVESWSPLRQLGRSSLFVYWIHVEMVYGLISLPLHKALTLPQALGAFGLFSMFMLACAIAKDRVVERWHVSQKARRSGVIHRS